MASSFPSKQKSFCLNIFILAGDVICFILLAASRLAKLHPVTKPNNKSISFKWHCWLWSRATTLYWFPSALLLLLLLPTFKAKIIRSKYHLWLLQTMVPHYTIRGGSIKPIHISLGGRAAANSETQTEWPNIHSSCSFWKLTFLIIEQRLMRNSWQHSITKVNMRNNKFVNVHLSFRQIFIYHKKLWLQKLSTFY